MKPIKRKRVLLPVDQNLQIMNRIEVGETLIKLSKEFLRLTISKPSTQKKVLIV